jgi:hypothetical protein
MQHESVTVSSLYHVIHNTQAPSDIDSANWPSLSPKRTLSVHRRNYGPFQGLSYIAETVVSQLQRACPRQRAALRSTISVVTSGDETIYV